MNKIDQGGHIKHDDPDASKYCDAHTEDVAKINESYRIEVGVESWGYLCPWCSLGSERGDERDFGLCYELRSSQSRACHKRSIQDGSGKSLS